MKPEQFSSQPDFSHNRSLEHSLRILGGLGVLGGLTLALAVPSQAQADPEKGKASSDALLNLEAPSIKTDDLTAPIPVEAVPAPEPVRTSAELLLRPKISEELPPEPLSEPVFEPPAPVEEPIAPPAPTVDAAPVIKIEIPASAVIDTTDYSIGATPAPEAPSLVFADRTRGCEFTLSQTGSVPQGSCGNPASSTPSETASASPRETALGQNASEANSEANSFKIGPVSFGDSGVSIGNTTVISREYFNESLRPLNLLRRGVEEFIFPLAVPAPITSLFGWRSHPIFGDMRFHAGTDLGAPEGTPVLATQDGKVEVADYLGGYGLTVILRHDNDTLETRYAHLSQILVRPGEVVKQGEVVGLVGSTGNSTGPHLHFELRELTSQGWVVHNPNDLLAYALNRFTEVLNDPLLALKLTESSTAKLDAKDKFDAKGSINPATVELPYRPAQPNAN